MKIQIEKIKELIKQGQIGDALKQLVADANETAFETDSILLISRYNKMVSDKIRDTLDSGDAQREYNKIVVSTLDLLDSVYDDFFHNIVDYYQVKFYETPFEIITPFEQRVYAAEFSNEKTRCVGWELYMRYPNLKTVLDLTISWQITLPDGNETPKYSTTSQLQADWFDSWIRDAWGNKEFNTLSKGNYKIKFFMGEKMVKSSEYALI